MNEGSGLGRDGRDAGELELGRGLELRPDPIELGRGGVGLEKLELELDLNELELGRDGLEGLDILCPPEDLDIEEWPPELRDPPEEPAPALGMIQTPKSDFLF